MPVANRLPHQLERFQILRLLLRSKLRKQRTAARNSENQPAENHVFVPTIALFIMPSLTWDQAEDIALALIEEHPGVDPLTVRFTDLHKWIVALPDFKDDPAKSNEGKLEAIQMAWHEEFTDTQ